MTDLRHAAQQALDFLMTRRMGAEAVIDALNTALEQQAEPPPDWPLIKNILDQYGLQAIDFVADWKAAQRPWVGLTPEEILNLFDVNDVYGSKWVEFARTVEAKLKERNG